MEQIIISLMQRSPQEAAKAGNIDLLYELIREDPNLLAKIDKVPFVDTPLHVAAVAGKTAFAMEIMNLEPSFARKLNTDGFTPLHLAVDGYHFWLVLELVKADSSLIRLKGRQGMTPLLLAVRNKKIDLISEFFLVSPESIVDANVNQENALHIAIKNEDQKEGLVVLKILMGWIRRLCQKDAELIETRVINRRDKDGNTPLHLAAYENNHEAMKLLLMSSKINVNIENQGGLTVLDIAVLQRRVSYRGDIERLVKRHGGKRSDSLAKIKTTSDLLGSKLSWRESRRTRIIRSYAWISEERRNALLVVATLILTATYQTILQPPGGVSDGGGNSNGTITSGGSGNTTNTEVGQKAGSVVMDDSFFTLLWSSNSVGFYFSMAATIRLLSLGQEGTFMYFPFFIPLLIAYEVSGSVIAPSSSAHEDAGVIIVTVLTIWSLVVWILERIQLKGTKVLRPKSGLVWEGFTTLDQAKGIAPKGYNVFK